MPPNIPRSPGISVNDIPVSIFVGEDTTDGGITETWTDNGLEVSVQLMCDWDKRHRLLYQLSGDATWDAVSREIIRKDPWNLGNLNDEFADNEAYEWHNFICTGTGEIRGRKWAVDQDGEVTGLEGWGHYNKAVIPATFAQMPFQTLVQEDGARGIDPSGYPYTTTKSKLSGEFFSPPNNKYHFQRCNDSIDNTKVGFIRPRVEYTFIRHRMPGFMPLAKMQDACGCVNVKPMRIGDFEYPSETVLVIGYETEPWLNPGTGLLLQTITWTVVANGPIADPRGNLVVPSWNVFMTKSCKFDDTGTYDYIVDSNGNNPYPRADIQGAIWPDYI